MMRSKWLNQIAISGLLFSALALGLSLVLSDVTALADGPTGPRRLEHPARATDPGPDYPLPPAAEAWRPTQTASDLSIQYISRAPRYNRYCVDYGQGAPQLCPGAEDDKHFPGPGEPVTFTAHVVNQGAALNPATIFTWTADGSPQMAGILPALEPGAARELVWPWAWQTGAHTVTLAIAPHALEISSANNRLEHFTDAHYMEVLVHPTFVQAFAERRNLVGTNSFADWLQAQFAQMNQRLAASTYEAIPQGVGDRVRIDVITPTEDVGGDIVSGTLAYDGRWTFRPERDYKRTPADEALASARRYAESFAAGVDWGLIHELAHQLGVIDLYQLNVSPSAGNPLRDAEGLPLLSGFQWRWPGLMGGDDVRPYDRSYFSEHTARALDTNSGYRRGYYGDYLFDAPEAVRLQVLDRAGGAVAGARIQIYQTAWNQLDPGPVSTGFTDASGVFTLPNRSPGLTVETATGHRLGPNPFGAIDVVGRNGQLLIQVQKQLQAFYRWLPITEMNKAAWNGQRLATVVLATHFAVDAAAPPVPAGLSARTAGSLAKLSWRPVVEAQSYKLYRGVWPEFYPFELVASDLTATEIVAHLDTPSRFAVTAVDGAGRESAFSDIARADPLSAPHGLVWRTSSLSEVGELLVVDGHDGRMSLLLPPEAPIAAPRWLGRVGSEHHGMVGAVQANAGPGETFAVALNGADRIWIMDAKQEPLNWFGRIDARPAVLNNPGGVALAGAPFTVDFAPTRPDPDAMLLLPFDGDLLDPKGLAPLRAEGLSFAPGRFGKAAYVGAGSVLLYPADGFDAAQGSVEFWFNPDWSGTAPEPRVLLEIGDPGRDPERDGRGYRLRVAYAAGGVYAWATDFEDIDKAAWGEAGRWQAGEWRHIAAVWDEQRLSLFVDGRLVWGEPLPFSLEGAPPVIAVGSTLAGDYPAMGAFDALRLSTFPRLGNSEHVRVLVSEQGSAAVKTLDLMGNLISSWVPDDDGPHRFTQLAVDAQQRLWVADEDLADVVELAFDGERLQQQRWLELPLARGPLALATGPQDRLAVADGASVWVFKPDQLAFKRRWFTANDGAHGAFDGIAALAFAPDGDLAVAEWGGRRLRFITEPLAPYRQFLPQVWQ